MLSHWVPFRFLIEFAVLNFNWLWFLFEFGKGFDQREAANSGLQPRTLHWSRFTLYRSGDVKFTLWTDLRQQDAAKFYKLHKVPAKCLQVTISCSETIFYFALWSFDKYSELWISNAASVPTLSASTNFLVGTERCSRGVLHEVSSCSWHFKAFKCHPNELQWVWKVKRSALSFKNVLCVQIFWKKRIARSMYNRGVRDVGHFENAPPVWRSLAKNSKSSGFQKT